MQILQLTTTCGEGNATVNDLIHDAVDPKRISINGHSLGTIIAPRVAIDNSTKVKNIILMGTVASNIRDLALAHNFI